MTKEEAIQKATIMLAYGEGKEILVNFADEGKPANWVPLSPFNATFALPAAAYKIKEPPKRVHLTWDDIKPGTFFSQISQKCPCPGVPIVRKLSPSAISDDGIYFPSVHSSQLDFVSFEALAVYYEMFEVGDVAWKPCYKLE